MEAVCDMGDNQGILPLEDSRVLRLMKLVGEIYAAIGRHYHVQWEWTQRWEGLLFHYKSGIQRSPGP